MRNHFLRDTFILSIVSVLFLLTKISFAQERTYQSFENTKVSLILPDGFTKVEGQPAYVHNGSASSIQVQEVPGIASYYSMMAFTKENIEQNNTDVFFVSEEKLVTNLGADAKLIVTGFTVEGMEFERIMFVTGDYNYTVIINCNYPKMTKKLLYDVLKKSLLTVKF